MGEDVGEEGEPQLLRVEFSSTNTPVEGCEIVPYVVVRMPNGEVSSAESLEEKTRGSMKLQFRWYRCSRRYVCSNVGCRRPAQMQFTPLYKLWTEGKPVEETLLRQTFLCSKVCLHASWRRLRKLQQSEFVRRSYRRPRPTDPAEADLDDLLLLTPLGSFTAVEDPEKNPIEQHEVGWKPIYVPTRDEIGHLLQVACRYLHRRPSGEVNIGPPFVVESRQVIARPPPPPERHLIDLYTREVYALRPRYSPRGKTFRVLTYNCLAEIYASVQQYPYCPSWALAWTYRKQNLLREIESYDADIICLQEVQADHFEDFFGPQMAQTGFECLFKSKTREAMGKKGKIDGCATFWSRDRYILREHVEVEYNAAAYTRGLPDPRSLKALIKGNIGQIIVLDEVDGSGCTVVVNTHIFWDPEKSEVKVFQIDALLNEIELVLARLGGKVAVIFAGDLNSPPDSAVYELVSTGGLTPNLHSELGGDVYGILDSCRLSHNLQFRSSYSDMGYEPPYTNYTADFIGTLDYVWYSEDTVVCVAIMEVPDETDVLIDGLEGMPNTRWSSDHIALLAEFQRL